VDPRVGVDVGVWRWAGVCGCSHVPPNLINKQRLVFVGSIYGVFCLQEDVESLIAQFQEQDRKRQQVVEEKCDPPSLR
jgi:hypothetical protein